MGLALAAMAHPRLGQADDAVGSRALPDLGPALLTGLQVVAQDLVSSQARCRTSSLSLCSLASSRAASTSATNTWRCARRCCGSAQSMSALRS